jgi:hypothetical protein
MRIAHQLCKVLHLIDEVRNSQKDFQISTWFSTESVDIAEQINPEALNPPVEIFEKREINCYLP